MFAFRLALCAAVLAFSASPVFAADPTPVPPGATPAIAVSPSATGNAAPVAPSAPVVPHAVTSTTTTTTVAAAPGAMPAFVPPGTDVSAAPVGLYTLDKNHATLAFRISHMGFSLYNGRFDSVDAKINLVDPKAPEKSTVDLSIDMGSIDTHNAKLEGELRDWFKIAQYPNATFHSTKFIKTGPSTGELEGDFSMFGQTHPVKLSVTFQGYGVPMMTKKPTLGFSATGVLKRSQWGLINYIPMIGDDVMFTFDAEFNKADAAAAAPAVVPAKP